MSNNDTIEAIRKAVDEGSRQLLHSADKVRGHLGASQIGHRCARQAWYGFHWAYRGQHLGRMMRLFDRGREEEVRVIRWLRAAGYEVRDFSERLCYHPGSDSYTCLPWDQPLPEGPDYLDDVSDDPFHIRRATERGDGPKQWGFVTHGGHFSGSNDGKIRGPHLPEGWGGVEFKTMNDKSFKDVSAKGVLSSKPVYWVQMQIYMRMLELDWCLFISVNKNDDEIYYEIVYLKPEMADQYIELARKIVFAKDAPPRLTDDPSWFECRYCDFREICHYEKPPHKNCRTCVFAATQEEGGWYCSKWHGVIPLDFQLVGCDNWEPI